jgi:hypothetical protein
MSDFMDRFIAAVSVLGLLVLIATASAWGPVVDGQAKPECVQPVPTKKVVTL